MSSEEKSRSSADATRDPAQPVLPTVNPDALKTAPEPASFHPAVYIAYVAHQSLYFVTLPLIRRSTWITLSSSTIVFNKYILDTAKFRTRLHPSLHRISLLTQPQNFPFSSQHGI